MKSFIPSLTQIRVRLATVKHNATNWSLYLNQKILLILRRYLSRLTFELRVIAPAILLGFLLLNLAAPKDNSQILKEATLQNPEDFSLRLNFAQSLLTANNLSAAQQELSQLGKLAANPDQKNQLGSVETKLRTLQGQPAAIKNQIIFWEETVTQLPSFRDAYIKLAILNLQLHRSFETQKFLYKALEIDPNNEVVQKMLGEIK